MFTFLVEPSITLLRIYQTNVNITETWNNQLAKLIGHKHLTIYNFIKKIKIADFCGQGKIGFKY